MQVAKLLFADPKVLKGESTLTHASGPETEGHASVRLTSRRRKEISPGTQVEVFVGAVHGLLLVALLDVDVVLMATDNHAAEVDTGQRCLHLGRRLIHAALQPDILVVQARCFGNSA